MKQKATSLLYTLPFLLVSILTLKLYAEDKLTLYVHPRYLLFMLVAGVIALLLAAAFAVMALQKASSQKEGGRLAVWISAAAATVLLIALVLPARPLSVQLAESRFVDDDRFAKTCRPYNTQFYKSEFLGWSETLAGCDDPLTYRGQQLTVEGFVYDVPSKSDEDAFALGRFVVSCCAVDARPLLLTVRAENWLDKYQSNQWLRVKGEIQPIRVNGELVAGIVPEHIEVIPEPKEPYVFY